MGILGALSTAVSGLSAQSYALENISGNIANSQTVGFKRVDTSFVDLIPDAPAGKEISGSVVSFSALSNTLQGTLRSTGVATNMALSGDGYFAVAKNDGSAASPTFRGENQYTRRGDFKTDANGYLVNGSNRYLVGTSYNPATGAVTGSSTTPIKLPSTPLPPKASTEITLAGNLPTIPKPNTYDTASAGSDRLDPTDFSTDPVSTGTVLGADETTFLNQSIAGGEITLFNSSGTDATAQLRWAKTAESASGNSWMLFYQTDSTPGASDVAWKSVGSTVTFNNAGQLTSSSSLTVNNLSIDGTSIGNVGLNFSRGLTQTGDANGQATTTLDQNGYTSGKLTTIAISSDGIITGNYSNGQTSKLAQVTVAHFAANDALKREDGGTFSATTASGAPTYGLNGTLLSGGSVEESNTDISDEFSKMIVTQQAYSANTRVMSTAQQMLQDVINVIR
ncbi:MAG: flagellar hook-basal body complex protein [Enterovirga sp.]|nr:flagellar hook-basal body complex protein [Enterovirga sp.]